jgi:hypothetical protein
LDDPIRSIQSYNLPEKHLPVIDRHQALLIAACTLAACSSITVTTDYDHSAPFGKYKTYALEAAKQGQTLSPTSEAAVRNALRTELAARGISEASPANADLAMVRHVFLQEKVSVQQYTDRYGHYGVWAGAPQTCTDVTNYTEGTMILDVVDTHTKKLVFRGTGTAAVGGPERNAEKIRDTVKKMVDALPTGAAHGVARFKLNCVTTGTDKIVCGFTTRF